MDDPSATSAPARVGLWGTFDLEEFGEVLFPRIARQELARRLPGVAVLAMAPFGGANRLDGGRPADSLGSYTPARLADLAEELDCIVVGPVDLLGDRDLARRYGVERGVVSDHAVSRFFVDGLGPELETGAPVVWCSVRVGDVPPGDRARYREALRARTAVSVRDQESRRRLEAAGVEAEVEVLPDPSVLVPRLFPDDVLDRRLAHLRVVGAFPSGRRPLVVQGDASLVPRVAELAQALRSAAERIGGAEIVLVETAPGDAGFAAAMAEALGDGARRAAGLGVEDVAAAIRASAGFIGADLRGNATAFAFGKPHLALAMTGDPGAEGLARMLDAPECLVRQFGDLPARLEKMAALGPRREAVTRVQARVDAFLDRVAGLAAEAAGRRRATAPVSDDPAELRRALRDLRAAHEARGRLLARQRWTFADRVQDAEARERSTRDRLEAEIGRLRDEVSRLEVEVAGKDRELRTLLNTRTFRYTAGLRRTWGAIRRALRR